MAVHRALALFALTLVPVALAAPAATQETDPPVLVRAVGLSPWVDADHPFRLSVRVTNMTDGPLDVRLRASFHVRVITRSALREALDSGSVTGIVASVERGVARPLRPGESRRLTLSRRASDLPRERGPYPVTIAAITPAGTQTLSTVVPIFPPTDASPLNLTWVMRIDRPPIVDPLELDQVALDELGLEALGAKLAAIGSLERAGVTLAPGPSFIDALTDMAERGVEPATPALSAFRAAARAAAEIATVPYASVDLPALAAQGPSGDVLRQIGAGRSAIERITGTPATLGAFVAPGLSLDDASLGILSELGVGATVVGRDRLREIPTQPERLQPTLFGPSFPFPLGEAGLPAVLPDLDLEARLASSTEGVLLGQAIVAETLGVWQELPLFAPDRVTVLAPERLPGASAIAQALAGLTTAPWIRMRPLSEIPTILSEDAESADFAPATPADRPYLAAARQARDALGVLDAITVGPSPDGAVLDRSVLLSESDAWLAAPEGGLSLARDVIEHVDAVIAGLQVAPRRITLTARTGDAPLTIINRNEVPLLVRIRLDGPKIGFPQGETRELELAPGDNTISFPVEARATGSFPVEVAVETPDGRRVLSTGRLVLRSTAVSAVSLGIVGGSALFLLAAWVRRAIKRDRSRPARARGGAVPR